MKIFRWVAVVGALAAVVFTIPTGASADGEINVEIDGISTGNAEGSRITVYEEAVAPEIVGNECTGTLSTGNNDSVHPGNAVVVTTNGVEYVASGVEDGAFETLTLAESFVIGDTLLVEVQFGPDGTTSGGLSLNLTCVDVEVEIPPTEPEPPTESEPDFTG